MNKFNILLTGLVILTLSLKAQEVKNIEVKPVGIYAEIDVDDQNRMMKQLYDTNTRNATVDTIFNNITHYNPPVIYLFSQALYLNGEKESALEWYLYAQLNAMYDAARCTDNTAKQAVQILEERTLPALVDYMKQNKALVTEKAKNVIVLFKSVQIDYDIRWINLHGLDSFAGVFGEEIPKETPELTKDKLLWPGIQEKVLKEFAKMHELKE